jgi:hypothetical protein
MNADFNRDLIRQLYKPVAKYYSDLRQYGTEEKMAKRMEKIKTYVKKIPVKRRNASNKKYRAYLNERILLHMKSAMYYGKEVPPIVAVYAMDMQLHDRHSWEEKETPEVRDAAKEQQIVQLMNFAFVKKSDDELRELI